MKRIPLTRGLVALVDAADFDWLSAFKWHAIRTAPGCFYAARGRTILMHRELLPGALEVDHINRNKLDNRRRNLRPATTSQNRANVSLRRDNQARRKGVSWSPSCASWRADITTKDGHRFLGHFDSVDAAARRYDQEAIRIFGEFACVNFPRNKKNKQQ